MVFHMTESALDSEQYLGSSEAVIYIEVLSL